MSERQTNFTTEPAKEERAFSQQAVQAQQTETQENPCCAAPKQAMCCTPTEKATCCAPSSSGTCGCQ